MDTTPMSRGLSLATEAVCLAMACLAPWAYGAVDAWAELALEAGIALLAALGLLRAALGGIGPVGRRLACLPSLALTALALFAWVQASPLPSAVLGRIAPETATLRARLVPSSPARVAGDDGPAVPPPAATLSLDREASRHAAARLAAAWIFFQSVLSLGGGAAALRRLAAATAVNAAAMALFGLVQAMTWGGKIYGIRPTLITNGWLTGGPFVCHSHLAAYLNLGLGCALGLLMAPARGGERRGARPSRGRGYSLWAAYAAGLIVVGIVASHSRSGFLAMVALLAAVVLLYRPGLVQSLAGLAVMLVLVPVFLFAVGSASPFERIASLTDTKVVGGMNGRVEVWEGTLRAWRDHPWWGMGLGSFAETAAPYFPNDRGVFYSHAENEYLQVLAEGGVVGLALGLAFWAGAARLGILALRSTPSRRERSLIAGCLAAEAAIGVQSLGDFALHIPGVAVTVVALAAHLCRLGLETAAAPANAGAGAAVPASSTATARRPGPILAHLALVGLALAVALGSGVGRARAEALLLGAGVPRPGTEMPPREPVREPVPALRRMRAALEGALRDRPDWAEGHLRRGLTLLSLYRDAAAEWLAATADKADADKLGDPLWLHAIVHAASPEQLAEVGGPLEHQPVRDYLVPAARSFLEARRCCPVLPSAHARLASVDYLLERPEPGEVQVGRVLAVAGHDTPSLALAAQTAVQSDAPGEAARCWRRLLEARPEFWPYVADATARVLSPEEILERVVPTASGPLIQFADRSYAAKEARGARDLFLRTALERAPRDPSLAPEERPWVEAQALARLGESGRARAAMDRALKRDPDRVQWREEFVTWLLRWGDPAAAHKVALLGVHMNPGNPGLQASLAAARDALAAGRDGRGPRTAGP